MRHVFGSHSEVAHVWANNWREVGHGSGKNVFFDGPTIYSYGRHFPIASFVTARDGSEVVLFTTRSYSVSTATHISIVRRALPPGFRVYYTVDPSSRDWRGLMRAALAAAARHKLSAARRRSDWLRDHDLEEMQAEITAARFFAFQADIQLPEDAEAAIAEDERFAREEEDRLAEVRKEREAAERERKAKLEVLWDRAKPYWRDRRDYPEALAQEARDLGVYSFSNAYGLSIAMRLSGEDIETSWGARFPVDHALRAFRWLEAIWSRGSTWERHGSGPRLGHYQIDRVTPEGVQAGCHWVARAEIELMAQTLDAERIAPPLLATA